MGRLLAARGRGRGQAVGSGRGRRDAGRFLETLEPRLLLSAGPVAELISDTQVLFVPNRGQWADSAVRFLHRGNGLDVALTDSGVRLELSRASGSGGSLPGPRGERREVALRFVDARAVDPVGGAESRARFNYFVGEANAWRAGVPGYESVVYRELYAGIDLWTSGAGANLKYEFHVAPGGTDYRQIRLRYEGAALRLGEDGAILADLPDGWGTLRDETPYVYQVIDGERVAVAGSFRLVDAQTYGFVVTGTYDPTRELVIDPSLTWAVFLGGTGTETGFGVTGDGQGGAWVTGLTTSTDFVGATGSNRVISNPTDAFVARLDAAGHLAWATYMGGGGSDYGSKILADGQGGAWLMGQTGSRDFFGTGGHVNNGSGMDVFVARLTAGGSVTWTTLLGGSGDDTGTGLASDGAGGAWVTGFTNSRDFLGAAGAFHGGATDGFLTRLDAAGSLRTATLFGNACDEYPYGLAGDGSGGVWVAGNSCASAGGSTVADTFVLKFNAAGSMTGASSLGADRATQVTGVMADADGGVWVSGHTIATKMMGVPVLIRGGWDVFAVRLTASGTLRWASTFGGASDDFGFGIASDNTGGAWVTGYTTSSSFTGATGAYHGGEDSYAVLLDAGGNVTWMTYLGGSDSDRGWGISGDGAGGAWVTGWTGSPDFAGALGLYRAGQDAFVAKIAGAIPTTPELVITSVEWTPGVHVAGSALNITITFQNQGTVASGPFKFGGRLFNGTTLSLAGAIPEAAGLAAAGSAAVSFSFTIPPGTPASTDILELMIDSTNVVAESNEANNVWLALSPIVIVPNPLGPPTDFQGDGRSDSVSFEREMARWWVTFSQEAPRQEQLAQWPTGRTWTDPLVGDVDGDGFLELMARAEDGSWWASRMGPGASDTPQQFTQWSAAVPWSDVHLADINGDRKGEIVGRADGQWWATVYNSTSRTYSHACVALWSNAVAWNDTQFADLNGDGRADVISRANGQWWAGISTGTSFATSLFGAWSTAMAWRDVRAADINGDGKADLVGRAHDGAWWAGISSGSALSNVFLGMWSTAVTWSDVRVADVNGDGKGDIVGRTNGGAWWAAVSGGSSFTNRPLATWSTAVGWTDVQSLDVDADGKTEVLARMAGTRTWWLMKADGATVVWL